MERPHSSFERWPRNCSCSSISMFWFCLIFTARHGNVKAFRSFWSPVSSCPAGFAKLDGRIIVVSNKKFISHTLMGSIRWLQHPQDARISVLCNGRRVERRWENRNMWSGSIVGGDGLGSGMRKMWAYSKNHIAFLKWEILKYICGVFGMLLQKGVIGLWDPWVLNQMSNAFQKLEQ